MYTTRPYLFIYCYEVELQILHVQNKNGGLAVVVPFIQAIALDCDRICIYIYRVLDKEKNIEKKTTRKYLLMSAFVRKTQERKGATTRVPEAVSGEKSPG